MISFPRGSPALLDSPLSKTIEQALRNARKISSLYTHQVAAINALARGKNVIVSTSTASGKSVIYQVRKQGLRYLHAPMRSAQVPVLRFLEESTNTTAMFIYPTKVGIYGITMPDVHLLIEHPSGPCAGSKRCTSGIAALLSRS
jgi:ATP-dependent helicase YprA (DUF1998 family)